jgi:hypothetical protein
MKVFSSIQNVEKAFLNSRKVDRMNTTNQARAVRYMTVKGLLDNGTFNKLEAQDILKGPLTPDDPSTVVDDSALLDKTQDEVNFLLDDTAPSDVVGYALEWFQAHKPQDRSEVARKFAIVITDLEKVFAFAKINLQ